METAYTNDEYWKTNSTFHEEDAPFKAQQCLALLRSAGVLSSIRTGIDIGCGSGRFLIELAPGLDAMLTGIDVSETPIERARSQNSEPDRVSFMVGDASTLGEVYDIAFLNDVFEHVDDYIGFLRNMRHVARMFYFNIPLDMHVMGVLRHLYMRARKQVGHLHYFSERSAIGTLEYAGYSILKSQHNWHVLHDLTTHPSARRYLAALPRLLSYRIVPSWSVHVLGGASLGVLCKPAQTGGSGA